MSSTTFINNQTIIDASWLNDVNSAVYNGTFQASILTPTNLVCNGSVSGTGFTNLVSGVFTSPGPIGNGTPSTGAFTTLSSNTSASLVGLSATNASLTTPTISGAVLSSMASSVITSGTAQNSTSGTSIDFTSLPSWVKRITIMFNGVSTNGSSFMQVQLGTGSTTFTTSGYVSAFFRTGSNTITDVGQTTGFGIAYNAASYLMSGSIILSNLSGNTWVVQGMLADQSPNIYGTAGTVTLGATLTAVRITTVNGTDTFDAGSINIQYQ